MNWTSIQTYLRDHRIDGWLIYDFRGSNPVLGQLLPGRRHTTRRAALFIPAAGEPLLLVHGLDEQQFKSAQVRSERYLSWSDFRDWLATKLRGFSRIAMEYEPGGALPVVSIVDAGTIEMVRSLGVEIVSSANLIQLSVAVWSDAAVEAHALACQQVGQIKDEAFELIRRSLSARSRIHEHEVQSFIMSRFTAEGLETPDPPIVAVNAHSGDPHYEPSQSAPTSIEPDDWILIDLWARRPGNENIFCDITWVGYCGESPTTRQRQVFDCVRRARDAVVDRAQSGWQARKSIQGWQLDEAARSVIIDGGFGGSILHRTGHSLSPGARVLYRPGTWVARVRGHGWRWLFGIMSFSQEELSDALDGTVPHGFAIGVGHFSFGGKYLFGRVVRTVRGQS